MYVRRKQRPLSEIRLHTVLVVLAAVGLTACGGAASTVTAPGGAGTISTASTGEFSWAEEVFNLTNEIRIQEGVPPLIWDERAAMAAYGHSWDMDVRGYFDHISPDGASVADRLEFEGIEFQYAGENIARGQASPAEVVMAWMDSPAHRENILSPFWTHVGVAVHTGTDRGPWWTQEFFR